MFLFSRAITQCFDNELEKTLENTDRSYITPIGKIGLYFFEERLGARVRLKSVFFPPKIQQISVRFVTFKGQ